MFHFEAENFIGYLTGGEHRDLHNTGSSHQNYIIVGQRLGFEVVNYPEQNKSLYRYACQLADHVDVAAVSHPRLFDDQANTVINIEGLCVHLAGKTFIQP